MSYLYSDDDILFYRLLLTEDEREAYESASIAWRNARQIVSERLDAALGS